MLDHTSVCQVDLSAWGDPRMIGGAMVGLLTWQVRRPYADL